MNVLDVYGPENARERTTLIAQSHLAAVGRPWGTLTACIPLCALSLDSVD